MSCTIKSLLKSYLICFQEVPWTPKNRKRNETTVKTKRKEKFLCFTYALCLGVKKVPMRLCLGVKNHPVTPPSRSFSTRRIRICCQKKFWPRNVVLSDLRTPREKRPWLFPHPVLCHSGIRSNMFFLYSHRDRSHQKRHDPACVVQHAIGSNRLKNKQHILQKTGAFQFGNCWYF